MSGYAAAVLKERMGIPFVVTFHALGKVRRMHQGTADTFPDIRFRIEEMVASEADALIAECPQDRDDLMILYFADPQKIAVIPCGFDRDEFHPMDRTFCAHRVGVDPEEKIVLQLGRMVPRKGVDNVIRASARLLHDYRLPVRLLIVGGETDESAASDMTEIGRLAALARELGMSDRVTFAGRRGRGELKYFYNAADVFVSTPWYEPFGITILEAMACGVPVIGANVGGIKYSVEHGKTGFLVPPNEPAMLTARVKEVLENPALARYFSRTSIARVNAGFTWETVSRQIAELYEHVLRRKAVRTSARRYGMVESGGWRSRGAERPIPPGGGI
jgi:glycosyltransferase involved in cell wall biosynthesis